MDTPEFNDEVLETEDDTLSKGERKKVRREEKQRQREQAVQKQQQKRLLKRILLWGIPLVIIGVIAWTISASPKQDRPDLISRRGIHWHVDLALIVKDQPVEIPANIGVSGAGHKDVHTHKVNDQLHFEMQRPVYKDDTRLGKFFAIWGKQFSSTCILDSCNGSDGTVKMLVNGQENTEFENYLIQDKDKIEIRYE